MTGPARSAGLLLAAGQGRRMGRPKALIELDGVPLVLRALGALRDGGVHPLLVVVGAAADEVAALLPADAEVVRAPDWQDGMGASLRAGLAALEEIRPQPISVIVHLVDLPGVTSQVVRRLSTHSASDVLARATYAGTAGHPVLFGRAHWDGLRATASGDSGGRRYLASRAVSIVECGDLGAASDLDTPADLRRYVAANPERKAGPELSQ
jgi:CTP:molybdopterin cytidylyltransferase MocA